MLAMLPGGLLELGAATLGAHLTGLSGLSIGWVAAICIEAIFMGPTVYKATLSTQTPLPTRQTHMPWLIETMPLSVIGHSYIETKAAWLMDTFTLPAIRPESNRGEAPIWQSSANDSRRRQFRLKPPRLEGYAPYEHSNCITNSPGADPLHEERNTPMPTMLKLPSKVPGQTTHLPISFLRGTTTHD
jgi:hypothetical protein